MPHSRPIAINKPFAPSMQSTGQNACTEQVHCVIECIVFCVVRVQRFHFHGAHYWRAVSDGEFFSSPILNTISIISESTQKSGWYTLIHLKSCMVYSSSRTGKPVHCASMWHTPEYTPVCSQLNGRTTYDSHCSFVPHSTRSQCMHRTCLSFSLTHSLD